MINYYLMNTRMTRPLPGWASRSVFPLFLLGAPTLTWLLVHFGLLSSGPAVSVSVLVSGLALIWLETQFPLHSSWKASPRMVRTDLLHCFVSTPLPPLLIATFAVGGLQQVADSYTGAHWFTYWPREWPLPFQIALGLVLSELGSYTIHRVCHMNRFFWRIHALHHSPRLLHTLASGRNHPFNVIAIYSARVIPLVLLGAGHELLACISTINGVHGMLQHVNLDIRAGWLNYVFAGPELHHRHHSLDLADSRTNFGNILIVWDLVFGTFKLPGNERMGPGGGVHELEIPEDYLAHLALPFQLSRWERPELAGLGMPLTDRGHSA